MSWVNFRSFFHKYLTSTMNVMNVNSIDAVERAVHYLKMGNVIAVPTDTIYGLACSAVNKNAVKELYAIKSRHESKPLAICMNDVNDIKFWAKTDHLPAGLLFDLLPGKVTVVLDCLHKLDNYTTSSDGKVGIRIPNNKFIHNIVNEYGHPIALTSANISGSASALSITEFSSLWTDLACIFDQGTLSTQAEQRSGSTVIDLSHKNGYCILRNGIVELEVKNILRKYNLQNIQ